LLKVGDRAVLDASVLVQCVVREAHTEKAVEIISMLEDIYVPPLLFYKVGNVLVTLARRNMFEKVDAVGKTGFCQRFLRYLESFSNASLRSFIVSLSISLVSLDSLVSVSSIVVSFSDISPYFSIIALKLSSVLLANSLNSFL
jgi:predicted nucleic acid-binding protein